MRTRAGRWGADHLLIGTYGDDGSALMPLPDVSGRYRGSRQGVEVELRVDVDGTRPMKRVSADYFRSRGDSNEHIGSMRIDEPLVSVTETRVMISGRGLFSWAAKHTKIKLTIPRVRKSSQRAPATLRHFSTAGDTGPAYVCGFESPYFRTVYAEEAREEAVALLSSYDTASLPSGGSARSLSPLLAFEEAGIETVREREPAVVDIASAGENAAWNDAELHAAMELSFSRWAEAPQWAIWLFHAVTHEDPEIFGLMFDREGLQRQGCAVFYGDLVPSSPGAARELLHACVHELGHGFNLRHCWQRTLEQPPLPSRPGARSWMNYPERFPGGPDAYWSKFPFEFDDLELVHLRHAFRDTVIMGGKPFAGSSAHDRSDRWDSESQDKGLRLKLHAPSVLAQTVPVTVGFELSATARVGRLVPGVLGPRAGTVDIAIRNPRGDEFVFAPLLRHCRDETKLVPLRPTGAPIRDYAFIHYGKHGFAFEDPGVYSLRARYTAPDGSLALSDEVPIRVRRPTNQVEREVARMISGDDEVGTLMSLVGSDAAELRDGADKLPTIIERYPTHPVADIARVIRGTNLARGFKLIKPDGSTQLRDPEVEEARRLLEPVIDPAQILRVPPASKPVAPAAVAPPPNAILTRPGVSAPVGGFVNSRSREVAPPPASFAADARRGAISPQTPPSRRARPTPAAGAEVTVNPPSRATAAKPAP